MDYIRRDLLTSGGLKKMIDNDGLRGMTSNPTIFEKAITGSTYYSDITESPDAKKLDAKGVYEKIAIRDVQDATDIFKAGLRRDQAPRRLRQPGSFAAARATTRRARSRKRAASGRRSTARKRDDQGSRRRPKAFPPIRQLLEDGHQHQHHAALRAVGLRAGRRSLYRRLSKPAPRRARTSARLPASPASSSAASIR